MLALKHYEDIAACGFEARHDGLDILVVEDNLADAHLIAYALRQAPRVGRVVFARDGVEALQLLQCNCVTPDLAIVDLHMPRMDGFRLLVEMSSREGDKFPIVVLTSSSTRADTVKSLLRGANKVISKPDSVEELEGALSAVIRSV